jgi:uncharacterized protein with PIN domain
VNVVDSSAWLAYFADEPNAQHFASAIEQPDSLIVPSITLLEVFKKVAQQRGEGPALQCVAVMQQGHVVDLGPGLALLAAALGARHKLPLADSIIYATAQQGKAWVWTQDADFEGLPSVKYFAKTSQ